jgi:uncharacterized protein YceH (UPF0502 family)
VDLTPVEIRVLGCLIEKQRTTPDAYPLSLNALRTACNQSTNRDPVVDYSEDDVREGIGRLRRRRWIRLASASRASKYRHLLDEELPLPDDQLAVLAVLMLRGDQTPGELKQRTERLAHIPNLAGVQAALDGLIARELVLRLERRPGEREVRYRQRLGEDAAQEEAAVAAPPFEGPPADIAPPAPPHPDPEDRRVDRLESDLAVLREELAELRAMIASLRDAPGAG